MSLLHELLDFGLELTSAHAYATWGSIMNVIHIHYYCSCWYRFDTSDFNHWKLIDFVICDRHLKESIKEPNDEAPNKPDRVEVEVNPTDWSPIPT